MIPNNSIPVWRNTSKFQLPNKQISNAYSHAHFFGISAIGGGACLIISTSGKLMGGLPLSILAHAPFADFLFPGIILFLVLGLVPCPISIALIKKTKSEFAEKFNLFQDMNWDWSFSLYFAFALIKWIQVETIFVQTEMWLQTF